VPPNVRDIAAKTGEHDGIVPFRAIARNDGVGETPPF
jgi:hypothetical protein